MLCFCNHVTVNEIKSLLKKKPLYGLEEIKLITKASTSCGRCTNALKNTVEEELRKRPYQQLKLF